MYPSEGLHVATICGLGKLKAGRICKGRIALCLSVLRLLLRHLLLSAAAARASV